MKTASEMQTHLRDRVLDDDGFRSRLLADPKAAIRDELGVDIPEAFDIQVHEEGPATAHLVIPRAQSSLSEEELKMASGGHHGPHWPH